MVLRKKEFIARLAKENQGTRTDLSATLPESDPIDTRKQLAEEAGKGSTTLSEPIIAPLRPWKILVNEYNKKPGLLGTPD